MQGKDLSWLTALLGSAALSGCMAMSPAAYMVSPETRDALKQYHGARVAVAQLSGPAAFEPMCRGAGNVRIANGLSLAQFVAKGFNDELRFAGLHGENAVQLKGVVTKAAFSSSASLVNGWWDLGVTLESSNGRSMAVENRYEFESGFSAVTACNNTSIALGQAVQKLVHKSITDPRFATLIR